MPAYHAQALLRDALLVKAEATDLRSAAYEAATAELEERLDRLLDAKRQFRDADNARLAARSLLNCSPKPLS